MKGKKLVGVCLILLIMLPVTLLAQGSRDTARPRTISVVLKSETRTAAIEEIFERFEEETGHQVEIQILPSGEEFGRLMQTRFATNDYPDLFEMDPGAKQYLKFRANETLYDWSDDAIMERVAESTRDFQTLDGKIYGVPWGSTGFMGVFYNKQVFHAAGLSVPENWEEFVTVARTLKEQGYIPMYEAINTEWPTQVFSLDGWTTYVDQEIGEDGVEALEINELSLNEIPALAEVLQKQYYFYEQDLLQQNPLAGTYDDQQEQFGQNRVGMILQVSGFLGAMEEKFGREFVDGNIGYFALPAEEGPGTATISPAPQFIVPRLTDNVDIAVELVRFMTQKENLNIWYSHNLGIPVYNDAESELYAPQQDARDYIVNGNATINIQNRLSSSFTDYPKILQNMFINGDINAALRQLDENYRRTGRARDLPGF